MNDRDLQVSASESLVQRFIDGELSGEERLGLLTRIGRDQGLRDHAIELERLLLEVGRLPRPGVPDDFVARVMARVASPGARRAEASAAPDAGLDAPRGWRRVTSALWTPRAFEWNLAGAMTAAALVLVAGAFVVERSAPPPSSAGEIAAPAASQVLVRLVVLQADAATVDVAGDFNGWDPRRTPLEQTSTGAWTVTIALDPGRYEYMFVIDGERWIADPFAVEQTDDGFGSQNAVLDVRPPAEASL